MADLVVGMAKSVVEGALTRAQAAIEEEALLRRTAQSDLVFITGEFQMMVSFLNVADEERVGNKVVRTWVRQIRELAYDVEDGIEFVLHLDKTNRWWLRLCNCCMRLPLDEAVAEIVQLKARVEGVSRRNTRYSLISDSGSKAMSQQQPAARRTAVAAAAFHCGKRQQGDLTQLLNKTKIGDDLQVISVWGTSSDLGVASVIWKAYTDQGVCDSFTCRAWVKIVHPFSPEEFARSLMCQFHASTSQEPHGQSIGVQVLRRMETAQGDCLNEFERQVNDQRYLIVLEDLSTMAEWDVIRMFFPERKKGSCIIVSTQQFEVACLPVGHPYQVLDLNQFSVDHSVYAFFREVTQGEMLGDDAIIFPSKFDAALEQMNNSPLIGRDPELIELRGYTVNTRFESCQVMSVWGVAGVGKSALVKNLFCDKIRQNIFNKYGWVDVSHPFNLRDFSQSLLWNFRSTSVQGNGTANHDMMGTNPIQECRHLLKNHNCLVIVDDLQSNEEWDLIQDALVSRPSQSLIIVITTEASIATYCADNKKFVFNVKCLETNAAFDLLQKEASKINPVPNPLSAWELAVLQELTLKCGGLPKIILAIAGLLTKHTVNWMKTASSINRRFMEHLETNREFDSLRNLFGWMRSYFRTCPDDIKPCIFYLSLFPVGHSIRRRRLVRRWVAEGYCRDSGDKSSEQNGEAFFSKLLELSIIQQSSALGLDDTRMVMCQVNGFIHEYIISRGMEENLVFELEGSCALTTQRTGRHLIIGKSWDRDRTVYENIDFSRLRSLTVFGKWESFFISKSMKLLRVLDLEDALEINDDDINKILKRLCRLKVLSLRGCLRIHHLPGSIGDLRQLQSLDVRHTSIVTLPGNIIKLEKLQYIRAGTTVPQSTRPVSSWLSCRCCHLVGVKVPAGIGNLTALHTLGVVDIDASGGHTVLKGLKKLTQLRKLGVSGIKRNNSKKFFDEISGLIHLESLSMQLQNGNGGCLNGTLLPLENLRSLKLYGLEDKLPEWESDRLSKLRKLNLEIATLKQDGIKFLGVKLPKLCILCLRVNQPIDGKITFCVMTNGHEERSYQKLKILEIACSPTLHVTFGSETMKKVELLKFDCSNESTYKLSNLDDLSEVKEILLKNSDEEIKTHLQGQLEAHPKKPIVRLES